MKCKPVTEIDIASLKGLIFKKAIESWRKLPRKMQSYIDIEDMYEDGVIYVMHFAKHYNPKKGKLTTILWLGLENFYKRGAEQFNAIKRYDGETLLLEDLKLIGFDAESSEEASEIRTHVSVVFLDVYNHASDELKESMRRWFLQIEDSKIHTKSTRFMKDKKEFKVLAIKYGLDVQDCRTLMNCSQIRTDVINKL